MSSEKRYWLTNAAVGLTNGIVYWVTKGFLWAVAVTLTQLVFAWLLQKYWW